ncbi:hypothetical protein B0H13DRAFT_1623924 [Mycena leptocephala]|nr:hypothetical protein B0H13DRAFT_1623924 [Mycena leptocephala]
MLNAGEILIVPSSSGGTPADVTIPNVDKLTGGPRPELPDEAPSWLVDSVAELTKVDLGNSFKSVLEALIRLEKVHGFAEQKSGITATGHPQAISDWIRGGRGRKSKTPVVIKKIMAYGDSFYTWWNTMQPSWRTCDSQGRWQVGGSYSDEWGILDCPGANGMLSVAAGLYFWGVEARRMYQKLWDEAVEDVVWMLEGLCQSLS